MVKSIAWLQKQSATSDPSRQRKPAQRSFYNGFFILLYIYPLPPDTLWGLRSSIYSVIGYTI